LVKDEFYFVQAQVGIRYATVTGVQTCALPISAVRELGHRVGARDVKDTANSVAKLPDCSGKVAVMGFCLGGLMTFLTAARYGVEDRKSVVEGKRGGRGGERGRVQ